MHMHMCHPAHVRHGRSGAGAKGGDAPMSDATLLLISTSHAAHAAASAHTDTNIVDAVLAVL